MYQSRGVYRVPEAKKFYETHKKRGSEEPLVLIKSNPRNDKGKELNFQHQILFWTEELLPLFGGFYDCNLR